MIVLSQLKKAAPTPAITNKSELNGADKQR